MKVRRLRKSKKNEQHYIYYKDMQ